MAGTCNQIKFWGIQPSYAFTPSRTNGTMFNRTLGVGLHGRGIHRNDRGAVPPSPHLRSRPVEKA